MNAAKLDSIGQNDVVAFRQLLIPTSEPAWVYFTLDDWTVKVKVVFDDTPENQGLTIAPENDYVILRFIKWENSLGTATVSPAQIGLHRDGRRLSFMAANTRVGNTNVLTLQFMASRRYG